MATIKIGGRDLDVRRASVGFFERCTTHGATVAGKTLGEVVGGAVDLIFEAVQDNGVTRQWVADNIPFPAMDTYGEMLRAVGIAAAAKEDPAPGEAKTQ